MIQKMKKVSFLVFHKDYDTFLEQLRQLGVVHVIEKEQGAPADETLQNNITLLSRYNNVIPSLQALADGVQPSGSQVGILDDYDQLLSDKSAIERRVLQLTQDCKSLEPWGDFSQDNVARLESAGYRLNYFVCDRKLFSEQWIEQYNATIVSDGKQVRFVTVTPVGEEIQVAAEQQSLPQVSLSDLQKELAAAEQQLEQNAQSIRQFAADNVGTFISQRDQLVQSINLSKVRLNGEGMAEGKLILLQGWIPAKNVDEVKAELDKDSLYYEIESPTPEDDVPILLSNNKFARLFEPLTHLYMLPQYNELDLTLFFAPFFMLFFGLCLGDMGYGLLMIVALPVFTKLFQLINPNFTKWLVVLFGLSTIICGSLSGSFFGFSLYDLDIPFVKSMKELLYTDNSKMFTLSLVIGVVQILFGMILKAVNLTIQCGFKSALGTIGWLILLLTVGACAVLGIPYGNPVVVALLVIALVGIFLLNSPGKNIFLNIGLGLWDTYNMATGLLGDVLSYVRLFALGLSGGILANVFNQMATGMSPDVPVVGFIVTVIIFLIGHGLNIFMNILGAIVHPMRLTFVEFFKNSGYTGGGVGYNPFR
ncbi:MAG: V-type ATPase 116kDa subunit family protein [Bacteroidales bacterium]|nr:V-type ATPase 116kDa subunit family protein [Bacteroidales bacterium]